MDKDIGTKTIRFGKVCRWIGIGGMAISVCSILVLALVTILIVVNSGMKFTYIAGIAIITAILGIALIPFYFIGNHYVCIGKIEVNTRKLLESHLELCDLLKEKKKNNL